MYSLSSLLLFGLPALGRTIGQRGNNAGSTICAANSRTINSNDSSVWPWQSYVSSNITPPYLQINRTDDAELFPGYVFLGQEDDISSESGVQEVAPFILTDDNDLVWGGPVGDSSNFRQQFWGDQSLITFWVGTGKAAYGADVGRGWGEVLFYDNTYQLVNTVCLQLNLTLPTGTTADCQADVHESFLTPDNTILLTAYNTSQGDLTSLGGPSDGWVYDSIAVEVDLATNEVVFIWSPLAHLPVNLTHYPYTGSNLTEPFDWFHMNSIQKIGDHYLINSRHLWQTFLVSKAGEIVWYIDGESGGDFGSLPANGTFSWQHMARLRDITDEGALLTYFNNHLDSATSTVPSTGLTLNITLPPNPASPPQLVTDLWDSVNPVSSSAEGSFTPLENGNFFMGYGDEPYIKEYSAGKSVVWSAQFADENLGQSYRAYKQVWHATPYTKLDLVVAAAGRNDSLSACSPSSSLRGYVSWNGATDVTAYNVYAGESENKLEFVGQFEKKGFETEFTLSNVKIVQVGAIQGGQEVRRSDIVYTRQ